MMGSRIVFVHLPEDRSFVFDVLTPWGQGAFSPNLVCKGQLRPGQKADSKVLLVGGSKPPRAQTKVAGSKSVADLRRA